MIKNIKFVLFILCVLLSFVAVQVSAQTVTMTLPAQNALDVGENSMIYVVFDRNVDAATVTSATFKVIGSVHGEYSGTITPTGQYILFSSAESFTFGEKITVISTSGIGFDNGTTLTNGYTFTFSINNCGDGLFSEDVEYNSTADNVFRIVDADFNGDGMVDLITTDGDGYFSVLLNDGNGSFEDYSRPYFNGYYFDDLSAADFDGDGDIDLVCHSDTWGNIAVLANDGSANFSLLSESGTFACTYSIYESSIFPADMDGDGDVDLLITRFEYDEYWSEIHSLVVLYNDGAGSFVDFVEIDRYRAGLESACNPHAADFNNDGLLDVSVMVSMGGTTIKTYLNDGAGGYTESYSYLTQSMSKSIVDDFDGDGYLDIAAFGSSTYYGNILVLKNNGAGAFIPQPLIPVTGHTYSFASGDFDGDSDIDFAVVNSHTLYGNGIDIFDNNGDGTFVAGHHIYDYFEGWQLISADVDSDKSADLITSINGQYNPTIVAVRKNYGAAERPVLYSPVNGKELDAPATPHLNCNDVANATAYYFEIDDDPNFGSPIKSPLLSPLTVSEWDVPEELGVGTYYWRVRAVNASCGIGRWSETWHIVVVSPPPPPPKDDYQIANFPNPFNPTTTISYNITVNTHVTIEVINLLGQTIKTLVDQPQEAGQHSVIWDGKNSQGVEVSSGVYFYRIQSDDFNATKKMMLLK